MNPELVCGEVSTSYGPLSLAVVVGDHRAVAALADAATRTQRAKPDAPVVVAAGWLPIAELLERVDPEIASLARDGGPVPASVAYAVAEWDVGRAAALDDVAVWQAGGEFRQRAWQELRGVRPGTVVTYAELAELAGNAKAARAAGTACATNLVAPFVPCHRVVQSGGRVGNYAYGVDRKARMLAAEGVAGYAQ